MTGEADAAAQAGSEEEVELDEFEAAFNEEVEKRESGQDPDALENSDDLDLDPDDEAAKAGDAAVSADSDAGAETPSAEEDQFKGWAQKDIDDYKERVEGWPEEAANSYREQLVRANTLDHRIKSDDGRVGALQRKINNLETDIAQIQKKPGQPSKDDITAAMATDEKWEVFQKDFPEVAEAIDSRLSAVTEKVDNTLAPVIKKQQTDADLAEQAAQQEAADEVAKVYPTWQTAVKEKDFHDWMANQSPGTQALAMSDDTRDASLLIGQYDTYRVENGLESLKTDHVPAGGDTVVDNADEVAKRRARQLEDGTTIESKPAQVDPNAESGDEFENAFNAFAARKAKNRA